MTVAVIAVPYHLGHERVGMGRGPECLLEAGAKETVKASARDVTVDVVSFGGPFTNEIAMCFEINKILARRVASAVDAGHFPLVLAGNCNSCLGSIAGAGSDLGIVWFDAHGDHNTPDTSTSGFFDGMSLAMATGRCWTALTAAISGFNPVVSNRVVLAGVRDVDPLERELLDASDIRLLDGEQIARGPAEVVSDALGDSAAGIYLHVDLDVLDPSEGNANEYATPGGPNAAQLGEMIAALGSKTTIRAAAITAYNPAFDPKRELVPKALSLIGAIVRAAAVSST